MLFVKHSFKPDWSNRIYHDVCSHGIQASDKIVASKMFAKGIRIRLMKNSLNIVASSKAYSQPTPMQEEHLKMGK